MKKNFMKINQDVINFSMKKIGKILKWNSTMIYISYKDVTKLGDWILNFPIFPPYDSHLAIQLKKVLRVKVKWKDEEMKEIRGIF